VLPNFSGKAINRHWPHEDIRLPAAIRNNKRSGLQVFHVSSCTDIKLLAREVIEPGKVHARHVKGDAALRYFLYVPNNINAHTCQFVSVHGVSRNALEHAERFAQLAEQYGAILVAPFFPKRHFSDYQRLGREGKGRRADHAVQQITREVESLTGVSSSKIALFGFSGGGQFAHRYTMAWPDHVHKVIIGAAGWYTHPEASSKFPYGITPTPGLNGVVFDMKKFLQVPACVLVGQWDIKHDPGLNQSARIQRQQGTTRLERGKRWIDAMNQAASVHDMETSYVFSILPGVNHDFTSAMKNSQMGQRVFKYLFGTAPSLPGQDEAPAHSPQTDSTQTGSPSLATDKSV
jgi:pimeloyl-ACP methyl ester carboxylesterase